MVEKCFRCKAKGENATNLGELQVARYAHDVLQRRYKGTDIFLRKQVESPYSKRPTSEQEEEIAAPNFAFFLDEKECAEIVAVR